VEGDTTPDKDGEDSLVDL